MQDYSKRGVRALALAAALAGTSSCTAAVDDAELSGEPLGSAEEAATFNDYAVGVVPVGPGGDESGLYGTACPSGTTLATIYMDDEDDDSETRWGWSWRPPSDTNPDLRNPWKMNTTMRFCKVNGQVFWPLTTNPFDAARFYAVLKLGQFCPNGSHEFTRSIDNEDDDNETWYDGPIAPNVAYRNTTLKFCFFTSGSSTMSSFPTSSVPYAVYHDFEGAQPAQFNLSKAKHYSDDEDDRNENSLSGSDFYDAFRLIVSDGRNTTFDLARVR